MLKIDSNKMMNDFMQKHFMKYLEAALRNWKQDVEKFASGYIKELGVPKADYSTVIDLSGRMIMVYFKANSTLLADVYGTGSKMIGPRLGEAFWSYWNDRGSNQGQVNPSRTTYAIEGRRKGKYIDIFGKEHESSGKFEGKIIEGRKFYNTDENYGPKGTINVIEPIEPNDQLFQKYFGSAIEIADKFFKTVYLQNALKYSIMEMDLSKYVIEVK